MKYVAWMYCKITWPTFAFYDRILVQKIIFQEEKETLAFDTNVGAFKGASSMFRETEEFIKLYF